MNAGDNQNPRACSGSIKKLVISPQLGLPQDAVTQKIAFIGRTGSGKTHGAFVLVEQMLDNGDQVVILDPVGVWYGLRLLADGKSPGYSIPVFGGLKGDIPLEPTAGGLIADLIVDRGISAVLDISQFESDADKARFARDWADRFFFRKKASPSAVHVVIEEAQEMLPQNPQREEARMLHAFQRMWKLGRNFGIGGSILTQRPQEVSKKALNQTELLFAFQMTGPQERKAIELWMGEKGIDTDIIGNLPGLKIGQCYAWSPQWLKVNQIIHIGPKKTFNSSSTPHHGGKTRPQDLAPIDLAQLQEKMKETIERAKDNDPILLKAEVRKLRKQLSLAIEQKIAQPPIQPTKVVEVSVIKPGDTFELSELFGELQHINEKINVIQSRASSVFTRMGEALNRLEVQKAVQVQSNSRINIVRGKQTNVVLRPEKAEEPGELADPDDGTENSGGLSRPQRTILAVLNKHLSGKPTPALALLSGFTVNGYFNNILSSLRSSGHVQPGQPVRISDSGRQALGKYPLPLEGEDLHNFWIKKIGQARARILGHLLRCYPETLSTPALAQATGYTVNGYFNNQLSSLRSAGLVVGRGTGSASASPVLFGDD